jgi:hypothetical protein
VKDYDPVVNDMLDRQIPLRLEAEPDWAGVLERADSRSQRLRPRWHRVLVPALAVLGLALAGTAIAAAAGVRLWGGPPTPQAIDATQATKLVEYTLTTDFSVWKAGDTIAMWRLPQPNGGVCVFTALASPQPSAPGTAGPNPGGGGFCGMSEWQPPSGKDIGVSLSTTREPGGYAWLINGRVRPSSSIATLELRSAAGRLPLSYANGWFLGELPQSSSPNELPQGGPYVVVGYDGHGQPVANLDLQQEQTRASAR